MASQHSPNMKSHAERQGELICVLSLGLVGVSLVLVHAFAAFSPVFEGGRFETSNVSARVPPAKPGMD